MLHILVLDLQHRSKSSASCELAGRCAIISPVNVLWTWGMMQKVNQINPPSRLWRMSLFCFVRTQRRIFVFSERCYQCSTFQLQCWCPFWVQKVWIVIGAHSNLNARCLVSSQMICVGVEAHLWSLSVSSSGYCIRVLNKPPSVFDQVSSVTSGFQAAVDLLSPLALFQFSAVTRGKESPSEQSKCQMAFYSNTLCLFVCGIGL